MAQTYNTIGHGEARLAINALRGGTALEMAEFLRDTDTAYRATYGYLLSGSYHYLDWQLYDFFPAPRSILDALAVSRSVRQADIKPELIEPLPEFQLVVSRISINSPGFWEFIGGLNPLLHIREYLKERHDRTKDNQYRNKCEQDRLKLENEILQQTLVNKQLENLRLLKDIDSRYPIEEALRARAWETLGPSYAKLGRHQDTGLIAGPTEKSDNADN